jgi:Flp pilus assembly secretin CpaC
MKSDDLLLEPRQMQICPTFHFRFTSAVLVLFAWSVYAHAEELTLRGEHTRVVTLPDKPVTIIVSNPQVADVTVKSNTLLFLGKRFGTTNVIVLDENGRETRNWQVHVIRDDPYGVAVFKKGQQEFYTCKADCEVTGEQTQSSIR